MSLLHPNLLAFMAIVERKTVQEAARKIGLTQTGVTQRIRSLERELGQTLFIRSRKGMALTHEGESLLRYCQSAVELEGRLGFEKAQEAVKLKISGPSSLMRTRVIPKLIPLMKEYTFLQIQFDLLDQQSAITKLKTGDSQIVIVENGDVSLEMDSKIIRPERYILVAPYAWRKRKIKEIIDQEAIIDFDENDQYTFDFLKRHELWKEGQKRRHFVNNADAMSALIEAEAGYSVMAEELAKDFLKKKRLCQLLPTKHSDLENICLAWYPRPHMPDYFFDVIKSIH